MNSVTKQTRRSFPDNRLKKGGRNETRGLTSRTLGCFRNLLGWNENTFVPLDGLLNQKIAVCIGIYVCISVWADL